MIGASEDRLPIVGSDRRRFLSVEYLLLRQIYEVLYRLVDEIYHVSNVLAVQCRGLVSVQQNVVA